MKIVCDNKIPFLHGVLEPYVDKVLYLPGESIKRSHIQDANALITRTRTKCDKQLLEDTSIEFISTATIGFNHIDTDFCLKNGITWQNAPGCNSSSVAQYFASVLLTLAVKHNIVLKGKTLGVIGVGNVGSKVAKLARTLGMNVIMNDPPRAITENSKEFSDLEELLAESDFITLHVPLEHNGMFKTFHLADANFLNRMKRDAFLINSSRGAVVDNQALKHLLMDKKIAGAALDVWENEPNIDRELLQMVELATPHIAGYSSDGKAKGTSMSVRAIAEFFDIEPLKNWYPDKIPIPDETSFSLKSSKSFEGDMLQAVSLTYQVKEDNNILKSSPSTFEKQRGNYRIRREFNTFSVSFADSELDALLYALGFIKYQ